MSVSRLHLANASLCLKIPMPTVKTHQNPNPLSTHGPSRSKTPQDSYMYYLLSTRNPGPNTGPESAQLPSKMPELIIIRRSKTTV